MSLSALIVEFMLFSFAGWVYESLLCTIQSRQWQNRGFLFGPVCPIYGSCAAEIASCRFTGNTIKQGVFAINESTVCVTDSSFASNDIASERWYTKTDSGENKRGFNYAVGKNGEKLEKEHFMQMKYASGGDEE